MRSPEVDARRQREAQEALVVAAGETWRLYDARSRRDRQLLGVPCPAGAFNAQKGR